MNPIFTGSVENGRLKVQDKPRFDNYLNGLHGPVQIRIEKETRRRSNNQNRYYWAVVVGEIAKHTGHDPEQVHELLKYQFSPKWHFNTGPILDSSIPTSTTRLDTLQSVDYT